MPTLRMPEGEAWAGASSQGKSTPRGGYREVTTLEAWFHPLGPQQSVNRGVRKDLQAKCLLSR